MRMQILGRDQKLVRLAHLCPRVTVEGVLEAILHTGGRIVMQNLLEHVHDDLAVLPTDDAGHTAEEGFASRPSARG